MKFLGWQTQNYDKNIIDSDSFLRLQLFIAYVCDLLTAIWWNHWIIIINSIWNAIKWLSERKTGNCIRFHFHNWDLSKAYIFSIPALLSKNRSICDILCWNISYKPHGYSKLDRSCWLWEVLFGSSMNSVNSSILWSHHRALKYLLIQRKLNRDSAISYCSLNSSNFQMNRMKQSYLSHNQ